MPSAHLPMRHLQLHTTALFCPLYSVTAFQIPTSNSWFSSSYPSTCHHGSLLGRPCFSPPRRLPRNGELASRSPGLEVIELTEYWKKRRRTLVEWIPSGRVKAGVTHKEGRTPLHVAVAKGHIKCARVLVESGADKDARSRDGRTALYRAAANGDRSMVGMLIQMGADPTIRNDRGRSALDVARDKRHSEVVEVLERGEEVLMAARRGDTECLELLLKTGAIINYRDLYGLTALHVAAMKGHEDVLAMLVEFGGDLDSRDDEGHSPLHSAVVGGSLEAVVMLVRKGAHVDVENNSKVTPLYMATTMGQREIAEFH
uniref:Uncharacterized protein n=1 Tax=Cannabis sativa TaxID=3483 RepID=A0A803QH44_CANSA